MESGVMSLALMAWIIFVELQWNGKLRVSTTILWNSCFTEESTLMI
jgi:hypothetical protein